MVSGATGSIARASNRKGLPWCSHADERTDVKASELKLELFEIMGEGIDPEVEFRLPSGECVKVEHIVLIGARKYSDQLLGRPHQNAIILSS